MFGKYLNIVPDFVPNGFDVWMANGGGTYIAPSFSTSGLEWHGIPDGLHTQFSSAPGNYTTALVSDRPCNVRREGGQSLVIGGSSLVVFEARACNPL